MGMPESIWDFPELAAMRPAHAKGVKGAKTATNKRPKVTALAVKPSVELPKKRKWPTVNLDPIPARSSKAPKATDRPALDGEAVLKNDADNGQLKFDASPAPIPAKMNLSPPTADVGEQTARLKPEPLVAIPTKIVPEPSTADINQLWQMRQDLRRAEARLNLQCQSICRRRSGNDREAGAALWKSIKTGESASPVMIEVMPYRLAMETLTERSTAMEKQLEKAAQQLPLWKRYGMGVRGVGPLMFAGLVSEARHPIHTYRSEAALWKRFGMAVIHGERQRRVQGTEGAALHGYNPERRSFMYNLVASLLRQRNPFYRELYEARKALELGRDLPLIHAHNRAMRYCGKVFLRKTWSAARAIEKASA
jgi:hypothetical protein